LSALSSSLPPALRVMADVVQHPAFPADLVTLEKKRQQAQIGQEKAQPVAAALRVLPRLLYGSGHAYGNPLSGSGDDRVVAALTRDELIAWHRAWFKPNASTLIVTGDVTMATLKPALEAAFGTWARGEAPEKAIGAVPTATGGRVYLIDKPDAPQSVIVAAHTTEKGGAAQDLAIEAVIRNFGGIATSRLNRNLRLEKHWSYGTQGVMAATRGPRPFYIVAPVQTDKTRESIVEIVKELKGVAGDRPLAGDEFASAMRGQTLSLPGRFETLDALEAAAVQLVNLGYGDDYFSTYATRVRGLTEPALAAAASAYIRPQHVLWVIVGDLEKVEAGIRDLKLGEVIRLDADGEPITGTR